MAEQVDEGAVNMDDEWSPEIVNALCSTDLEGLRESLLERIVNEKKMELMRSPEVISWLATKQREQQFTSSQNPSTVPTLVSPTTSPNVSPEMNKSKTNPTSTGASTTKRELRSSKNLSSNDKQTAISQQQGSYQLGTSTGGNTRASRTLPKS